jgi:hypothetical protein
MRAYRGGDPEAGSAVAEVVSGRSMVPLFAICELRAERFEKSRKMCSTSEVVHRTRAKCRTILRELVRVVGEEC